MNRALLAAPALLCLMALVWAEDPAEDPAPKPPSVENLVDLLADADARKRVEAFSTLVAKGQKAMPEILRAAKDAPPRAMRHVLDVLRMIRSLTSDRDETAFRIVDPGQVIPLKMGGIQEEIGGSVVDKEGRTIRYSLKATGKRGQYALKATVTGAEGDEKTIEDEGTMRDLQKKYPFLKGTRMFHTSPRMAMVGLMGLKGAPQWIADLGVLVSKPGDALAHHLALPQDAGTIIMELKKDSPAEQAGLRRFDVVLRINGELVEDGDVLKKLSRLFGKEEGLRVDVIRRAKPKSLGRDRTKDDE